ncbi:hypothetical protein F0562_004511 [Nyssa sinensis]|uniref:Uncharacterized protein n=1 Tax=Nyssa sinensis TaxID=561372 RepID=A0A5J5BZ33_9ASTE|nr:hypothetical protein F0562_004511 [Nyssa sinensis]
MQAKGGSLRTSWTRKSREAAKRGEAAPNLEFNHRISKKPYRAKRKKMKKTTGNFLKEDFPIDCILCSFLGLCSFAWDRLLVHVSSLGNCVRQYTYYIILFFGYTLMIKL